MNECKKEEEKVGEEDQCDLLPTRVDALMGLARLFAPL